MQDGQVQATTNEQSEELESQVAETSVIEQIGQLLGNQSKEVEEIPPETKQETEPIIEPPKESPKEFVDDALVEQFPRLKMYLGKPLSDIPKAYDNLVLAYQKDHLELIKLKQEQAKKSIPKPEDFPDSIEKPDEFKKALADYREKIRQETLFEIQNQPQPVDWVQEVGKVLPQGTDTKNVLDQFTKFNASRFYNEMGEMRPDIEKFYNEHPMVLLDEIKSFYNLHSVASKTQSTIAKEGNETAYKTITNSLKKAQGDKEDLKGAQFNPVERSGQLSAEQEMLAKIYKKTQSR